MVCRLKALQDGSLEILDIYPVVDGNIFSGTLDFILLHSFKAASGSCCETRAHCSTVFYMFILIASCPEQDHEETV